MSQSRDLVPVAPLLVTVIAVCGLTSAVWSIFWQQHDTEQSGRVAQMAEHLEQAEADKSRLLDRYTAAEQARRESELTLLTREKELETLRQQLAGMESENWPARYAALKKENYNLSERIEELELRSNIERDNYIAEYEQLQERYNGLQHEFLDLEREHASLEQQYRHERDSTGEELAELRRKLDETEQQARLQHALERDLIDREIDDSRLENRIAELERQRQALQAAVTESEQRIQTLKNRSQELSAKLQAASEREQQSPPPVQELTTQAPPRAVPAAASGQEPDAEADTGFRQARIQSLQAAMQNASSADRKAILLTVLPTIPDGVEGTELAELVAGMDSGHIIEILEDGRPHIQRPVDNDSYKRIMRHLEDGDSRRLATRLLQ